MLTALILQLLQCIVIQYNEQDNMETTPSDDNQSKVGKLPGNGSVLIIVLLGVFRCCSYQ